MKIEHMRKYQLLALTLYHARCTAFIHTFLALYFEILRLIKIERL